MTPWAVFGISVLAGAGTALLAALSLPVLLIESALAVLLIINTQGI